LVKLPERKESFDKFKMALQKQEERQVEQLLESIKGNPPTGIWDYASMFNRHLKYLSGEARELFYKGYIEIIGPERAFAIGSTLGSTEFDIMYSDSKLMKTAFETISESNPQLAEKLYKEAEGRMKASRKKPMPQCALGGSSLSEILGDVTPEGRKDRRTGLYL
jgi:hypothetical protein